MPSTTFSLNFFLEIAVFVCFCSLSSCKLLTSLLSFKLRIELLTLPEAVGQFIALSLQVYDIHFQTFFKLFSFCCSFRQIIIINEMSHPVSRISKKNISTDNICHRCFVCWTICVFMNVF